MRPHLTPSARSLVLALSLGAGVAGAQSSSTVAQQLAGARAAALAGDLDGAEATFSRIALTASGGLRVDAEFGLAFVHQQRLVSGDTSGRGLSVASVLAKYGSVEEQGSRAVRQASATNRGLLLVHAGEARRAAEAFDDAARWGDASATALRLRAAEAWLDVDQFLRADRWFRVVLDADSSNPVARAGLLTAFRRAGAHDSLLAAVRRWRADTGIAPAITDAILMFLTSDAARGDPIERSFFVELARNLTVRRMTGETFIRLVVPPLVEIRADRRRLDPAIQSMLEAFTPFGASGYRVGPTGDWWRQQGGEPGTAMAWSGLLRMIGDQYRLQPDREQWARRYYEVALGFVPAEGAQISADADPAALRQLGLIYARQRDRAAASRLAVATERFATSTRATSAADSAKALRSIRDYHVAMGSYLTRQREIAPDLADQADHHVIKMIEVGDRIALSGAQRPRDPTNLLTDLAISQQARGRTDSARAVTERLAGRLQELNVRDASLEAERRVRDKETTARPRPRPELLRPDITAAIGPGSATVVADQSTTPAASAPARSTSVNRNAAATRATGGLAGAVEPATASASTATGARPTAAEASASSALPVATAVQSAYARLLALAAADDSAARRFGARRDSVIRAIGRAAAVPGSAAHEWNTTVETAKRSLDARLRRDPVTDAIPLLNEFVTAINARTRETTAAQRQRLDALTGAYARRATAFGEAMNATSSLPRRE